MPSRFTGALRLTSLDADCLSWRLEEPLHYEVGVLGSGKIITVPAGFETDGASIPPLLRGILPPFGRYSRAAILHDYICRNADEIQKEDIRFRHGTDLRKWGDGIFFEALQVCGVSKPLIVLMWVAVALATRFPILRTLGGRDKGAPL